MHIETEKLAEEAFASAVHRLRSTGANPTNETLDVLWLYFRSGVQFGLDHAHRERQQIVVPGRIM